MKKLIVIAICMFIPSIAVAQAPAKSKFYDFGEQVIDGEMKKPTALYINEKKRVEFGRLLNLKKSFLPDLEQSAKENVFK
jgi:hypothetical protein